MPVPVALQEGVHVLRVYANGKTQNSFLTLSDDKFTLYLSKTQKNGPASKRGWLQQFVARKHSTPQHQQPTDERTIDIGSIERIQRGHANKRFELARYVCVYACA
jgi:hypothetical protein